MNPILVHLNAIKGVGPATIEKLTATATSFAQLYDYEMHDFVQRCGMTMPSAQIVYEGLRNPSLLQHELANAEHHNISIVTIDDPLYPAWLRSIYLPPPVLYVQGVLEYPTSTVALVGARAADHYAQRFIDRVVPGLVNAKVHVVSGGAYGTDTMAHKATLASEGKTTVVLGSGLLRLYPQENKELFAQVWQVGGCVMSPFPLNAEPLPHNFPIRNRIIAGLSQLCVVVQAASKSGALITAQFALAQGREVGAVPGDIENPLSAGCHALLKEGAHMITSASDIMDILGIKQDIAPVMIKEQKVARTYVNDDAPLQRKLQDLCARKPMCVEEMMQQTNASLVDVQNALFDLHLEGVVKEVVTGYWRGC